MPTTRGIFSWSPIHFMEYIYCLFVVVFLLKKKKKKKTEKKSRSAVSRSVVPPFRVPSFHGLLTTEFVIGRDWQAEQFSLVI